MKPYRWWHPLAFSLCFTLPIVVVVTLLVGWVSYGDPLIFLHDYDRFAGRCP